MTTFTDANSRTSVSDSPRSSISSQKEVVNSSSSLSGPEEFRGELGSTSADLEADLDQLSKINSRSESALDANRTLSRILTGTQDIPEKTAVDYSNNLKIFCDIPFPTGFTVIYSF